MDKRKSLLNVSVSVSFKILTIIVVIFSRRLLIEKCGNEVNGLNALYLSIIGILSVAELGVGSAISFCMYKPIVDGNHNQVSALYHLFRRIYTLIGMAVLAGGLLITPFISHLAKDYVQLDENLQLTFLLMLTAIVLTYFFGAKTALINAYKNNYITNAISSCGTLIEYILQIIVLITTQSFALFLVCKIISSVLQWVATDRIAQKKYSDIMLNYQRIDQSTRKQLTRSIRAMFMHKIGNLLVNSADSVIISFFIGVIVLGEYSNYTTILRTMTGVIDLVFISLTSVFGHVYASQSKVTSKKYFEVFHLLNFIIGALFHLGYYAIIDNLIAILFSPELVVRKSISFIIALNGFVQFMRQNTLIFRDATGAFYNDRWKPLIEGTMNVFLSVLLVNKMGVTGVIAATVATNLLVCHIVEPYVLYRHSFDVTPRKFFAKNYSMIALFVVMLVTLDRVMVSNHNVWAELLANGFISVGLTMLGCIVVFALNKEVCMFAMEEFGKKHRSEK